MNDVRVRTRPAVYIAVTDAITGDIAMRRPGEIIAFPHPVPFAAVNVPGKLVDIGAGPHRFPEPAL